MRHGERENETDSGVKDKQTMVRSEASTEGERFTSAENSPKVKDFVTFPKSTDKFEVRAPRGVRPRTAQDLNRTS